MGPPLVGEVRTDVSPGRRACLRRPVACAPSVRRRPPGTAMTVAIGTSGWSYPHWDHVLYPPGTPPRDRLGLYVQRFDTVELNASFYRWPRDSSFVSWRKRLPPGFQLSVKAPRGLTHGKRLYAPETWVDRVSGCWHELGDRRGVLLVQLPPGQVRDDARLDYFLGRLPWWLRATAPFVYVRLHGPHPHWLYAGSYSDDDLRWWADRVREWEAAGRDVYLYFNNDGEGHAVRNALTLRHLLGR